MRLMGEAIVQKIHLQIEKLLILGNHIVKND